MEEKEKRGMLESVQHLQKSSGQLVISYTSLDEIDGILKHTR